MDLEVFIKDEDLEIRTPLHQLSNSDLESSMHDQDEEQNREPPNSKKNESGRQTNVSVYELNSQDGQRNKQNSRLKSHNETGADDDLNMVTDSRLHKFAS